MTFSHTLSLRQAYVITIRAQFHSIFLVSKIQSSLWQQLKRTSSLESHINFSVSSSEKVVFASVLHGDLATTSTSFASFSVDFGYDCRNVFFLTYVLQSYDIFVRRSTRQL